MAEKGKDWMLSRAGQAADIESGKHGANPAELPPSKVKQVVVSFLKGPLAVLLLVVVGMLAVFFYLDMPKECSERWQCGEWSACENSLQHRLCIDESGCGTLRHKPYLSQACTLPPVNTTSPKPDCTSSGIKCNSSKACCGHCLRGYCRDNLTYCGDVVCDPGENCTLCPYDCGDCPGPRDLPQNVFTEPLTNLREQELKKAGYVLVRYFHTDTCDVCKYPVDIEAKLREAAAGGKGVIVLMLIDSNEFPKEAEKYCRIGAAYYTPLIRVEGAGAYQSLYGRDLTAALVDFDLLQDIGPLICDYSEYCEFWEDWKARTAEWT